MSIAGIIFGQSGKILRLPQTRMQSSVTVQAFELDAGTLTLLQQKGLNNPFSVTPLIREHVNKLFEKFKPQSELDKVTVIFGSLLPYNTRFDVWNKDYFGIGPADRKIQPIITAITDQKELLLPEEMLSTPEKAEKATDFEYQTLLLTLLRAAGIRAIMTIDEKYYKAPIFVQLSDGNGYFLEVKETDFNTVEKLEVKATEEEALSWFYYLKGQIAFIEFENKRRLTGLDLTPFAEKTIHYLETALSLKPDSYGAWFCLGATLRYQGQETAAKNAFAVGQYYEAMRYLKHGDRNLSEALEHLDEALRLNPEFVEAWFETGKLLYRMRRQIEAKLAFDKAIKYLKAEESDQNKNQIAESYFYRGMAVQQLALLVGPEMTEEYERAAEALERAAISFNDPALIFNSPFGRFDNYDHRLLEEVGLNFDEALKLKPDYPEAWVEKGKILLKLNQGKEAIESLLHAVRLQKNHTEAWFLLGFAYLEYGAEKLSPKKVLSVAAACFTKAFDPERENPDQVQNLLIMAVNFARLRRRTEALLCLDIVSRYGGQEFATRAWKIRALILKAAR